MWLRGEDIGPHPEDPRQTAAPMPSQMDLLCSNSSNGKLPQSYLSAMPKNKRHMIHKKKNIISTNPGVNMEELVNHADIPPDIKKALQDLEFEEMEEPPDEQQLEVLEDIWLKAGEMGKTLYIFIFVVIIIFGYLYFIQLFMILLILYFYFRY